MAARKLPAKIYKPKIVEYQCGSSDIIQSNEAKVIYALKTQIQPYSSSIQEYLVDIPQDKLKSLRPDSLVFKGEISYKNQTADFTYTLGTLGESSVSIKFVPRFLIIRPFNKDRIDRLVEPTYTKVIIKKPSTLMARAKIEFITPSGVQLGAYKKQLDLRPGERMYEIGVPVVVRKSMGPEKQKFLVNLVIDGKLAAADQIYIGGGISSVNENLKIAPASRNKRIA